MNNFAERIKGVRHRKGMSQSEFAKFLGVSVGSVGNWESGVNVPPEHKLVKIAEKLGLDADFFLQKTSESLSTGMQLRDEDPVPYGAMLPQSDGNFKPLPVFENKPRRIPVISFASAGTMHDYSDLEGQIQEYVWSEVKDPNAFALIIEGSSMEPLFYAKDRVIFAPNEAPINGDIVVAKIKDTWAVQFKRFRRTGPNGKIIKLEAINPDYESFEFPEENFVFIYPAVDMKRVVRWSR
jgi:SOS-response transcriptional repressor LexA